MLQFLNFLCFFFPTNVHLQYVSSINKPGTAPLTQARGTSKHPVFGEWKQNSNNVLTHSFDIPVFLPTLTLNYVFLHYFHDITNIRRYDVQPVDPRNLCLDSQIVTLFVSRQMEAGSLVSCREDISAVFPEQTPGAKYNVGYSSAVGGVVVYCRWS